MPFIPHSEAETREMLAAIGVSDLDALFDEIPASLRCGELEQIPEGLSEMQVGQLMGSRARQDGQPLCFIGAGAYDHHIPAAVWQLVSRGEFYSAYTPYQAEASQVTLQLLYEYQSMMSALTRHWMSPMPHSTMAPPVWLRRCRWRCGGIASPSRSAF